MYQLVADQKKCKHCGNCDNILPDRWAVLRTHGRVLISPENFDSNQEAISAAIDGCHFKAMALKDYEVKATDGYLKNDGNPA